MRPRIIKVPARLYNRGKKYQEEIFKKHGVRVPIWKGIFETEADTPAEKDVGRFFRL